MESVGSRLPRILRKDGPELITQLAQEDSAKPNSSSNNSNGRNNNLVLVVITFVNA